jgi:hypothetical protein
VNHRARGLSRLAITLTVAISVTMLAGCSSGDGGRTTYRPARTATPSASPARQPCHLKTLESGFSFDLSHELHYGVIVSNPCREVAQQNLVVVSAISASGNVLTGDSPQLPAIMPGERVGLAGNMSLQAGSKVNRLKVGFRSSKWTSIASFNDEHDWPKPIVTNIHLGARNDKGTARISFDVRSGSNINTLSDPIAYVILRDGSGNIVSGEFTDIGGYEHGTRSTGIWTPKSVDRSQTEVYVVQGFSLCGYQGC